MIWLLFFLSIDERYHTAAEIEYELDSIAGCYPAVTELHVIGYSTVDSMPIYGLKISDNPSADEDEPAVLYIGCHHAEEILGTEICMYMIEDLLSRYQVDSVATHWIDNREIWIIPLMNPEGQGVVMSGQDTIWRKNKHDNNNSGFFEPEYDGVDLNRNYDFYWSQGGTSDPTGEFYRGPYAFSESEDRAIRDLALRENFMFCASYHSARYGLTEVIYFPWHWSGGYSADYPFLRTVADSVAKRIVRDSGIGNYTALPGEGLDGNARNWLYGICGTFALCIEVSTTTIQPGWMVDGICQRNLPGAYYLLERCEQSGITGIITDSSTGLPLNAEIRVQGYYDPTLPPRRSDPTYGRFTRIVKPGTYNIEVRKRGYVPVAYDGVVVVDGSMTVLNTAMTMMEGEAKIPGSQKKISVRPNPARNSVLIHIDPEMDITSLGIYDACGRLVRDFSTTSSSILWQCDDENSRDVATGVYWLLEQRGIERRTHKIVLIREPGLP